LCSYVYYCNVFTFSIVIVFPFLLLCCYCHCGYANYCKAVTVATVILLLSLLLRCYCHYS
jgi:hypothetical protein